MFEKSQDRLIGNKSGTIDLEIFRHDCIFDKILQGAPEEYYLSIGHHKSGYLPILYFGH